jgi:hypothetical protein
MNEVVSGRKLMCALSVLIACNVAVCVTATAIVIAWHNSSTIGIDQIASIKSAETIASLLNKAEVGRELENIKLNEERAIRTLDEIAARQKVNGPTTQMAK